MMLNLRDHAARAVPGSGLVLEAAVADERRVTRSATGPGEQVLDLPLQDVVGRQPDRVAHSAAFQRLVERRQSERGVRADHHGLPAPTVAINDGQEDLIPALGAVDVARPEFHGQAVALWVEDEERVIAHRLEVTVVRGLLLCAVDGAFGAVDVERHASAG